MRLVRRRAQRVKTCDEGDLCVKNSERFEIGLKSICAAGLSAVTGSPTALELDLVAAMSKPAAAAAGAKAVKAIVKCVSVS